MKSWLSFELSVCEWRRRLCQWRALALSCLLSLTHSLCLRHWHWLWQLESFWAAALQLRCCQQPSLQFSSCARAKQSTRFCDVPSFSSRRLSRTLQQPSSSSRRYYRCRSRESELLLLLLSLSSVCLESLKRELAGYTEASLLSSLLSQPSYGASLLGAYTYTHLYISVRTLCVCVRLCFCVPTILCIIFCARSIKTELHSAQSLKNNQKT